MVVYIELDELLEIAAQQGHLDADDILNCTAADVAPVVHGGWKYYKKQGIAVCTNCSFERNLDDNFGKAVACPNCGARMGGG